MSRLQERDIAQYIRSRKTAELILEFDDIEEVYLVSIKLGKNSQPAFIYTQRGSIKSFKCVHRAIHWGGLYNLSKAIVIHPYPQN